MILYSRVCFECLFMIKGDQNRKYSSLFYKVSVRGLKKKKKGKKRSARNTVFLDLCVYLWWLWWWWRWYCDCFYYYYFFPLFLLLLSSSSSLLLSLSCFCCCCCRFRCHSYCCLFIVIIAISFYYPLKYLLVQLDFFPKAAIAGASLASRCQSELWERHVDGFWRWRVLYWPRLISKNVRQMCFYRRNDSPAPPLSPDRDLLCSILRSRPDTCCFNYHLGGRYQGFFRVLITM